MTKLSAVRSILFASIALGALPAVAQAQEPPAVAGEEQPTDDAVRLAQVEQAPETVQPVNEIRVTGLRQQYRGDVPIQELPQSISVISSELLKDVGVTQLADALDLASGVNRQNNFGGIWDAYAIRGFAGDPNLPSGALVNGFNAGRGFGGPRDASNIERIEILKGPNSALFGRGEPGGTVNVVTKKPEFSPEGSFTVSGGSFGTVRAEGDYTTPLNGSIAVRANGSYNFTENFRDVLSTTRYTVTPSVLVKLTPSTILSYELEYINLKLPFDRGVVSVNNKLGLVPRRRFFGEPGDGRFQIEALGHQVQLQHTFNRNWNALLGFGYRDTSFEGFSSDPEITPSRQLLYLRPDLGRMSRQRRLRNFDTKNLVLRGEVSGEFDTGGIRHHLLFGADYDEFDISQVQMRFRPPSATAQLAGAFGNAIDIYNPVYGSRPTPGAFRNILEKQRGWGAYFQDQVDLTDRFKLRFGGRYDEYRPRTFFRPGDFNARVGMTPQVTFTRFSPQAGAVFEVSPAFSIYTAYGEGFRPNSDTDVNSNPFEPETTRSYEVGAKFTVLDTLNGTVALFEVKKNNVLTADPINAGFSRALGSARSRGFEFDLNGELPGGVMVWIAYAYLDAEVGANAGDPNFGFTLVKGDPLLNIPKHSGNILATKDFAIGARTLMLGAGVNYVSSRLGETGIKSFRLPDHTLVKLVASYELSEKLKLSGEVSNVFDEVYYPSSFARLWVTPGTPRSFTARLSYSF